MPPALNPSAEVPTQDRAIPSCPHFGPCGGCQLQHLAYPAQLDLKAAQLHTLLEATGLPLPELQLHPSPPLAYRNRIRVTLAKHDGQLRAGYLRATTESESPTFLPITECPIAAPILWRAAEALLAHLNQSPSLWLRNPNQVPDQIELFATADESRLQFTLYLRTAAKSLPKNLAADFTTLCDALHVNLPELTGAGIAVLPARSKDRSRRNEQPRPGPAWGSPGLLYSIPTQNEAATHDTSITQDQAPTHDQAPAEDNLVILTLSEAKGKNPRIAPLSLPVLQPASTNEIAYWLPRTAFFQVNRFLLPELLALVTANRTGPLAPKLAFDLYAGVGLFSRALAARFTQVIAVEIAEPAASALAARFTQVIAVEIAEPAASALAATKLRNLRAVKSTTLDFLRTAVTGRDRPDLIVLDPPRSGAGREVCKLLARIGAPTVVYVSCSPESLPADLLTLAASGYRIAELHLLDLFPQTTHIETVAILTRPNELSF